MRRYIRLSCCPSPKFKLHPSNRIIPLSTPSATHRIIRSCDAVSTGTLDGSCAEGVSGRAFPATFNERS